MQNVPKRNDSPSSSKIKIVLIIMGFLLIAACVAVLILLPQWKKSMQQQESAAALTENPVKTLALTEDSSLKSIEIFPNNASSYLLFMDGGSLKLQYGDELLTIDETYEKELRTIFTALTAQDTIAEDESEVKDALTDMGLEPALSSAVATFSDGTTMTVEIGNTIPETSYSYMRWSGGKGIYACDEGMKDALNRTADRLLPITQPEFSVELIESISLQNEKGSYTIILEEDDEGNVTGALTKPYSYPASDESVANLLSAFSNFHLGSAQKNITLENAGEYGFDHPVCEVYVEQSAGYATDTDEEGAIIITPVAAQSFHLTLGMETREHFYTCEYEGNFYLISKYLIQPLLNMGVEDFVTHTPMNTGDARLASVVIWENGKKGELTVQYNEAEAEEEEEEDNEEETEEEESEIASAMLNEKEISAAQAENLLNELKTYTIAGTISEDIPENKEELWQMELTTTSGKKRILKASVRDHFTAYLSVDGITLHYIQRESSSALLNLFLEK